MDSYVESEGDDWSVPTEGNEFMFIHMTIVNQTSDDLVISSMASFENYCDDTKLDYSAAHLLRLQPQATSQSSMERSLPAKPWKDIFPWKSR